MKKNRFSGWTAVSLAAVLVMIPSASPEVRADQETGDEGGLIEDNGQDVSIEGGLDYESVQAAIAAEDAARSQVQTLIDDPEVTLLPADENSIREYLTNLTAEVNPTGSYAEMDIASYIEDTMASWGYTVSEQNFHEGEKDENGIDQPGVNILAERGPDGSERTDQILILTAHYDAKRQEDSEEDKKLFAAEIAAQASEQLSEGTTEAEDLTQTYSLEEDPLANDKYGAAVLLETARILADIDSNVDVAFVFLSGEEDGYYGSSAFIQSLEEDFRQRVSGVICVDRVGYADDTVPVLLGTADGLANEPAGMLEATAENLAVKSEALTPDETEGEGSGTEDEESGTEIGQSETDTVENSSFSAEESALSDWSVVKAEALGTAQNFIAWSLPTVCVSQDEESIYRWYAAQEDAEEETAAEVSGAKEAEQTAEEETATEEAAVSSGWGDAPAELAQITDVIANAAAAYMKPDQSGLGTIASAGE